MLPSQVAAAGAVAAILVVLTGAVIAGSQGGSREDRRPQPELRWSPGACVTGDYALTPCNGGRSEVVAMASDPPGPGDCPVDTDDVLRVGSGRTACVRNFLEPHPGAPGEAAACSDPATASPSTAASGPAPSPAGTAGPSPSPATPPPAPAAPSTPSKATPRSSASAAAVRCSTGARAWPSPPPT
ncbi:hypothetical protein ACFQYP_60070 [Nonomuraea antimicrobica]